MKAKRIISLFLAAALLAGLLPALALADNAAEVYSISNGYIAAQVSAENGGFTVTTVEGSQLKKSDNNQRLLYHNGTYDTSFISFRVTDGAGDHDYIFGGVYGGLTDPSRQGVSVTQPGGENSPIQAVWSTGSLTFTVSFSLANSSSNEYGMVSLSVKTENAGTQAVSVKTRILYDTCLGNQDYGFYQISDGTENSVYKVETVLNSAETTLPKNFFATDSIEDTRIAAYSANGTGTEPYQIAMGHWNNLAASLFDFTPDGGLDFSDPRNDYQTADSAYALYYDLGTVTASGLADLTTFYGVFSNSDVSLDERVALNVTASSRLEYNEAGSAFSIVGPGLTNLQLGVTFENYDQPGAAALESCTLVVTSTGNLRPLETDDGTVLPGFDYTGTEPLTVVYSDVAVGKVISKTLNFQAKPVSSASYERLTVSVYDTGATGGQLIQEALLGTKTVYVLLPGNNGDLPSVGFVDMSPKELYYAGVHHLYVSLTNSAMLEDRSKWNLYAENQSTGTLVQLDQKLVTFRDDVMDVVIGEDIRLTEGTWALKLVWTDDAVSAGIARKEYKTQTAECLRFAVSADPELKNSAYGIAAVVRFDVPGLGTSVKPTYRLKLFADEAELQAYSKAKWEDGDPTDSKGTKVNFNAILLTFRGEFTVVDSFTEDRGGVSVEVPTKVTAVSKKYVDSQTRKTTVDNCVTINNCLDFEDGTMSIYYYGSPLNNAELNEDAIRVEFDGELLTSIARTTVWSGKACFTEFKQGDAVSLQTYDGNKRYNTGRSNEKNIALVWPAAAGVGQKLAGMVFNLAFGEMGAVYDNYGKSGQKFLGYVVSFTANLDLSFVSPKSSGAQNSSYWKTYTDYWSKNRVSESASIYGCVFDDDTFRTKMLSSAAYKGFEDDVTTVSASVMVPDVMFGCGQGFYGVHFSISVGLANYSEGLPSLQGTLEVNTIGDWSFSYAGGMETEMFETQFRLSFKSYKDIPIPDDIYFYFGDFDPGVNIDGFGVVWITGGGGGFSNLYDTVMCVQKVPPLKLILTVSFSIIQVLDGTATLQLGPTGISLDANDLTILELYDAIEHIGLSLEWWPGIDLKAAFHANLFYGMITGSGYIAVVGKNYKNWLYEMFLRASVNIPGDIPFVGGVSLGNVDLGINNKKIWGTAKIITTAVGITYYWGNDGVDFGLGADNTTSPTFPELLGCEDIPVYYDEERNDTLYLRVGTNLSGVMTADVIDEADMRLMAADETYLLSDSARVNHEFMVQSGAEDAVLQLVYDAGSPEEAKTLAKSFTMKEQTTDAPFALLLYDAAAEGDAADPEKANANVTWNPATGKASFAIAVTDASCQGRAWELSTGMTRCEAALYSFSAIPEVLRLSADKSAYAVGEDILLTWNGAALNNIGKSGFRFYLAESNAPTDPGYALTEESEIYDEVYYLEDEGQDGFVIPENIPAGEYYVKCIYSDENTVNSLVFSESKITVTNDRTPGTVGLSALKNTGSSQVGLTAGIDGNTDGVAVTVYAYDEVRGTYSEAMEPVYFDAEAGAAEIGISVGGSYSANGESYGLEAGKTYALGVKPYKLVDTDGDGEADALLSGQEVRSDTVVLTAPTIPSFSVKADQPAVVLTGETQDGSAARDTYTANDLSLTFRARRSETDSTAETVTGTWSLDGAEETDANFGSYSDAAGITVTLNGLIEGNHVLTLRGEDAQGDGYVYSYDFTVDTLAPRLVVAAPLNGAQYDESGIVSLRLLTDPDALLTVSCDGTELSPENSTYDVETGIYTAEVVLPDAAHTAAMNLQITASDATGNLSTHTSRLYRGGLAGIRSVVIAADGLVSSDGVLAQKLRTEQSFQLELQGVFDDGTRVSLSMLPNVNWTAAAVNGSAQVDAAGVLTVSAGAQGFVTGSLEISTGAYLSYTLIFGETADENGLVRISSTLGGVVTGAGRYAPGETVTVSAAADKNYSFDGWTSADVILSDASAESVTFTMPESGNVNLTATFTYHAPKAVSYAKQKLVHTVFPAGADENLYVPCYYDAAGKLVPIQMSAVIDGELVYLNPEKEVVYVTKADFFRDDDGMWGEGGNNFAAARGIVEGVGDCCFRPDGTLTRGAFVTILYRLSGSPAVTKSAVYSDVRADAWYADAVSWATAMGIVQGNGDGSFAPDSPIRREQMCAMIVRYLNACGYTVAKKSGGTAFTDDASISAWAKEEVRLCRDMGLIQGRADGSFAPLDNANRMECCTIIRRVITAILNGMTD